MPDQIVETHDLERAVAEAIALLPERLQTLITLRYGFDGEPQTYAAIGRVIGVTKSRVAVLEQQALSKIRRYMFVRRLDLFDWATADAIQWREEYAAFRRKHRPWWSELPPTFSPSLLDFMRRETAKQQERVVSK